MKARDILEIIHSSLENFPNDRIDTVKDVKSSRTGELQEVVVTMKAEEGDPDGVQQVWGLDQDSILDPEDMQLHDRQPHNLLLMSATDIRQFFASLDNPTVDESLRQFSRQMIKFFVGEITERQAYNEMLRFQKTTPAPKLRFQNIPIGDKFTYIPNGRILTKLDDDHAISDTNTQYKMHPSERVTSVEQQPEAS